MNEDEFTEIELQLYKNAIDDYCEDYQIEQIQEAVADGIAKAIQDRHKGLTCT